MKEKQILCFKMLLSLSDEQIAKLTWEERAMLIDASRLFKVPVVQLHVEDLVCAHAILAFELGRRLNTQ